jgi:lipoate-protein ligase A
MLYYIESSSVDPYYNLALEQVVFDRLDRRHDYFMLWQNDNSIIIGKHQNTLSEINSSYVKENGIKIARRLSGGGAVYHDMGNLNFTFVADSDINSFDFALFCKPVQKALSAMGVSVDITGRNDMTIDGKKFSGNAQYMKKGRVMHHGTIMFDTDMSILARALRVDRDKIESKGIKSVRSRVTNIKPYMKDRNINIKQFWELFKQHMFIEYNMADYTPTPEELAEVQRLRDEVYSTWDWNYGASPAYSVQKTRRIDGCGRVDVFIDIKAGNVINDIAFFGDYFGNGDSAELAGVLKGCRMEEVELRRRLGSLDISYYFAGCALEGFIDVLLR